MTDNQNPTSQTALILEDCERCSGLGFFSLPPRKCSWCHGKGYFLPLADEQDWYDHSRMWSDLGRRSDSE